MFRSLGLAGLLLCVVGIVFGFYLRRVGQQDFVPPNAKLLIDAWNQDKDGPTSDQERVALW